MVKRHAILLSVLQAIASSRAAGCDGDASTGCNGMVNTCTSDGLCVVNTATGTCCLLSPPYGWNGCVSDQNGEACEGLMGSTSYEKKDEDPSLTAPDPTPMPSRPPTRSPTPQPSTGSPTVSSAPTETCFNIEIGLVFDEYPGETKWEITKGRRNSIENDNAIVLKTSPYYDPDDGYEEASETHIVCLPKGRYTFTIMDRNKDGMCCNSGEGRYAVTYKETGEIIAHGSKFDQYEAVSFAIPFVAPILIDADGDGLEDRTKNVIPPMLLGDDGFPPAKCENEFGLHLETDDYGVETTWELRERASTGDYSDGKVVASGGPYTSEFVYDISYCLHPGEYTFVFYDWQCDGLVGKKANGTYALLVNGRKVHTGGTIMEKYWEEFDLKLGPEPANYVHSSGYRMSYGWMLIAVASVLASVAL